MSIKTKMIQLALVITACVSAMAVTAIVSVRHLSEEFRLLRSHEIVTQLSVIKLSRDMNYLSRLSRDIMLGGDYERDMKAVRDIDRKVTSHFEALEEAADNDEIRGLIATAKADAKDWFDVTKVMMTELGKVPADNRHTAYKEYEKVLTPRAMKARGSFARILEHSERNFKGGVETFEATITESASSFIVISLIAVVIIALSFLVILRTIFAEIENRRYAEEALSASEKTARALLDGIVNSAYLIDPDGIVLAVNAEAARRSGKDAAELVGSRLWDHYADAGVSRSRQGKAAQAIDTGRPVRFEDERNGRVFDQTYCPVFNDAGEAVKIAVVAIDVTEQKKALNALEESEKRFRTLIETAPIGISMCRDLHYTYVNGAFTRMFGFSAPSDLVGTHVGNRIAPHYRGEITELILQCVKFAQGPCAYETTGVRQDGASFPLSVDIARLVFQDGPLSVSFSRDMTEHQQARDLMIQAEKMAMVGGLAAGMAHEINNPTGIIIQNLQNIERRLSPDLPANHEAAEELGMSLAQIRTYLEERSIFGMMDKMHHAGERTAKIISNMLQFSRMSGSERKAASLPDIIERAVELAANDYDLKKKYDFRQIEISRHFAADLPPVPVIATELEQVMINIFKNAAQAMVGHGTHQPHIDLTAYREESMAVIKVVDNGPGMDEATRKRVFEPFFTTKEVGVGTGLGLSVSYTLITQNHKGVFSVDSAPGDGACFTIKLPLG